MGIAPQTFDTTMLFMSTPSIKGSATIYIVEGEKDVDVIMSAEESRQPTQWALVKVKWRDEYSEFLRGRNVVVIPDNDEPGRNHAQTVADSLLRHGVGSVKILAFPTCRLKATCRTSSRVAHDRAIRATGGRSTGVGTKPDRAAARHRLAEQCDATACPVALAGPNRGGQALIADRRSRHRQEHGNHRHGRPDYTRYGLA
jgi:hypothetical protein